MDEPGASGCSRCGGPVEEGFLLTNRVRQEQGAQWVQGKAEANFLGGLKVGDQEVRSVTTWRCTRCGHLDSYAGPPLS